MDSAICSLRCIPSRGGAEVSTARAALPVSRRCPGLDLGGEVWESGAWGSKG